MQTIAIVDYGMGNLHSVGKAMERVAGDSARVLITHRAQDIADADRVVFPGVGAMRDCMNELNRLQLVAPLKEAMRVKPVLCICVGMQSLMDSSEENDGVSCLSVVPGRVRFLGNALGESAGRVGLKIPHMGWNQVRQVSDHPMWAGIEQNSRFYFVHSYFVEPNDAAVTIGECEYGVKFAAAIATGKVFAVQFHPEKSQRAGLQLLGNFVRWPG